ncbi:hypothetical protein B0J14DRAFT_512181 [Halenospora varia]|nr:hypothetical protein B0J14DRAFT_512181 [Halenospora varia]
MTRLTLNPVSSLRVSRHQIPNTSIQNKPLLIYHSCLPASATASSIESHLKDVGVVTPEWRYTMYSRTHFHSTTHEVLCISGGNAKLCFGGEENPGRVEAKVQKGDMIIVPAGVGHRLLDDFDSGFEMVGGYPKGKQWDMCYGAEGEEEKVKSIGQLGWFGKDPLYGDEGPAIHE